MSLVVVAEVRKLNRLEVKQATTSYVPHSKENQIANIVFAARTGQKTRDLSRECFLIFNFKGVSNALVL